MITLRDKKNAKICQKNAFTFYCNFCDYGTCKKK